MCGIWFSIGMVAPKAVIDVVSYRGPDGDGWEVHNSSAGPVSLGHRRLAVFDLSDAGKQPMTSPSGNWRIVYNGEIYNFLELRRELANLGVKFSTVCDTEVLLAAIEKWGPKALHKLNGMFSFVAWNEVDRKIFAARDRFGIKPMYIAKIDNGFAIASEIKQLLCCPNVQRGVNFKLVSAYVAHGLIDHTNQTLFNQIKSVPAGHMVWQSYGDQDTQFADTTEAWYTLPSVQNESITDREAATTYRELLASAVSLRMRADVHVGSCLSGGLDSSSIVSLATQGSNKTFTTVSACYENWSDDEQPYIDALARHTGCNSTKVFPTASGLVDALDQMTYHQDLPVGSMSAFAQWSVFETAAKNNLTVMLDGQGADEQLAGYMPSLAAFHAGLLGKGKLHLLWRELGAANKMHQIPLNKLMGSALKAIVREHIPERDHMNSMSTHGWLNQRVRVGRGELRRTGNLSTLLRNQFLSSTMPALLRYEDRNSMAFGVEARLPFLDYRCVEFAMSLPDEMKISNGQTKAVLRRALHNDLPLKVRDRTTKIGFSTPDLQWFQGAASAIVKPALEDSLALFPGMFEESKLRKLASSSLEDPLLRRALWRVISLSRWGRVFDVAT